MAEEKDIRVSRRAAKVDIDREFKLLMTVVHREVKKLMDLSYEDQMLTHKDSETVIAYTKLLGALKRQIKDELENMDPEEVRKLARENNK